MRGRKPAFKHTKRLFVIATEGEKTEPIYFQEFTPGREGNFCLKILETRNGKSKPLDVLARLIQFEKQQKPGPKVEYWAVIDRDSWTEDDLNDVAREIANRPNYYLALSNPCFELWLWFHLRPNRAFADRHDCQRQLERAWSGYSKGDYDAASLIPHMPVACELAKSEDQSPDHPWPRSQATRVYKLIERLQ
jgi:hypothetical protein